MGTAARPLPEPVVLVVDDDDQVCRLLARILTDAGFRVLEAHSGAEAVAWLATLDGTVQLVVSDICMPEMSGIQLADVVPREWPNTPVVLMSGQGGPGAGYNGVFLAKPFIPDHLLDVVGGLVPLPKH